MAEVRTDPGRPLCSTCTCGALKSDRPATEIANIVSESIREMLKTASSIQLASPGKVEYLRAGLVRLLALVSGLEPAGDTARPQLERNEARTTKT